jgi:hypothetical protein
MVDSVNGRLKWQSSGIVDNFLEANKKSALFKANSSVLATILSFK